MLVLSSKVRNVEDSQTLALSAKARRLKENGVDVVSLTAGEPDFPTPRHIKEAAIKAVEENFTYYTPNNGNTDLVNAICRKFSSDNGLHFEPDQILVSSGAKQSIFNALQAICNKGDEVVILSPYWVSYPEMVKLVDAVPVTVGTTVEQGFRPDLRAIRRAIHQKTKAIIVNSPCNPTGIAFTRSEIEELAQIVRDTGIYVISDEIYEKLLFDGQKHFSIGAIKSISDQVITVNGVSKAYAMTGWRIGFMGGPVSVIQMAARVQSQITSGANSIAQKATVVALLGPTRDVSAMVEEFQRRRDLACESLSSIEGVQFVRPVGAFYVFFDVRSLYGRRAGNRIILNSADMAEYLLDDQRVAVVPGASFGDDGCIRISYACGLGELGKGLERIRKGLGALR